MKGTGEKISFHAAWQAMLKGKYARVFTLCSYDSFAWCIMRMETFDGELSHPVLVRVQNSDNTVLKFHTTGQSPCLYAHDIASDWELVEMRDTIPKVIV